MLFQRTFDDIFDEIRELSDSSIDRNLIARPKTL